MVDKENPYPDIIKNLPEAKIDFKGVRGWLSQGKDHQIVFFDIEPIGEVTEHSHSAQWGIVIEGELELTIGGTTKTYKKGDSYYIPDGVVHSAVVKRRTLVLDIFADRDRYKAKN
ncbi:MAG: cupin domain-containing protein [Methanomassiliicoccales archaeon]|nr:MAG: cupin domain-containing protein [Methanomassiliicoccales archaeon]